MSITLCFTPHDIHAALEILRSEINVLEATTYCKHMRPDKKLPAAILYSHGTFHVRIAVVGYRYDYVAKAYTPTGYHITLSAYDARIPTKEAMSQLLVKLAFWYES